MYYRRKILLAFLQKNRGQIERLFLQKLLFIFSKRSHTSYFDFDTTNNWNKRKKLLKGTFVFDKLNEMENRLKEIL